MISPVMVPPVIDSAWKILLVDDEPSVHQATKLALRSFAFAGQSLQFFSAHSAAEAIRLMSDHPDMALILLDVVMETPDAGLQVARYVRHQLNNRAVRIILRTGQPGQAPEESVVLDYEINDYKTKLELTQQKLFTTFVAGLRSYQDIITLQQSQAALHESNQALQSLNETLELRVQERTQELAAANQQLRDEIVERRKAQAAQNIYLHALTHDLRNPIIGIINVLKSLLKRQSSAADEAPYVEVSALVLQRMEQGCDRLLKLIDSLLDTHAIESCGVSLQREPFALAPLINTVLEEWQPKLVQKRIQVVVDITAELPHVDGDRDQIWRVFDNLISNALKHNQPDISLTIQANATDPANVAESDAKINSDAPATVIHCTLTDNGIGIDPEHSEDLFALYRRGTASRDTSNLSTSQGLGLGLYTCRKIIDAHGGQISIVGEEQQGTQVRLSLPAAPPEHLP